MAALRLILYPGRKLQPAQTAPHKLSESLNLREHSADKPKSLGSTLRRQDHLFVFLHFFRPRTSPTIAVSSADSPMTLGKHRISADRVSHV